MTEIGGRGGAVVAAAEGNNNADPIDVFAEAVSLAGAGTEEGEEENATAVTANRARSPPTPVKDQPWNVKGSKVVNSETILFRRSVRRWERMVLLGDGPVTKSSISLRSCRKDEDE